MIWQQSPYMTLLMSLCLLSIVIAVYIWWRYRGIESVLGMLLILANTEWILSSAFQMGSVDLSSMIMWNKIKYIGLITAPTIWLVFTIFYARLKVGRLTLALLSIVPLTTLILTLTNEYHRLIWISSYQKTEGPFLILYHDYGSFFYVYTAYSYVVGFLGSSLLVWMVIRHRYIFRWQTAMVLLGALIPLHWCVPYLFGYSMFPFLEPAPFMSPVAGMAAVYLLLEVKMRGVISAARDTIIDSMSDSVIVLDSHDRVVDMNAAALNLTGASHYAGQPVGEVWPSWSEEMLLESTGREIRVNNERTYDLRISSLKSWRGDPACRIVVIRDITETTKAERAVRESEKRYRLLAENTSDVIVTMDLGLELTYVSPSAKRLAGYTTEEVIGQNLSHFVTPRSLEVALETVEEQLTQERMRDADPSRSITLELEVMCKDGSLIWVEATLSAIRDVNGNPVEILGVVRDITERRKAEEEIKKFKAISDRAEYGSAIADRGGTLIYVNDAFARMNGYRREELMKADLATLLEEKEKWNLLKKKESYNEEIYFKRKDSSVFPALVNGTVVKDEKGNPSFMAITVIDITERKKQEDRILASLKEKEVLLREIHHRVKNNMQIISSLLSLQSRYLKNERDMAIIRESQNRIKSMALIHEKLYKSEDLANINAREYFMSIADGLVRSYGARGVKVTVEVGDVSLGMDAAIPCGLIVNELLSNSLKHAFPQREGEVFVVLSSVDGIMELTVRDNGLGIPEEIDFRNTDSLGLRLVTILAEDQLGGKITLRRDKGTEFCIQFKQKE